MQAGDVVADRFEVEEEAAAGGMGVVYRARDRHAGGRTVALKMLQRHSIDRRRFEREAEVLSGLRHPGIVMYIAHGVTADKRGYLAMEWLDGETLSDRLKQRPLSIAETLRLGLGVTAALAVAHRANVVHRDLKPSNIFLPGGDIDRVKVIDFGIARAGVTWSRLTSTGEMLGTPGYMSPEQAHGESALDARADVFSLGCVLFKCLTGASAFRGDDALAVLLKVVLETTPRVSSISPGIPPAIDDLVARMLAKAPGERPADADAVHAELAALHDRTEGAPAPAADAAKSHSGSWLTGAEQQVVCVALARPPAEVGHEAATVTGEGGSEAATRAWPTRVKAWRDAVGRSGGALSILANGALLVTVGAATRSGAARDHRVAMSATDLAAQVARCALALAPLLGGSPVAIAAGKATVVRVAASEEDAPPAVPIGEVIDRGVRLLASGDTGEPAAIVIDHVVLSLLEGQFDVRADGERRTLQGEHDAAGVNRAVLGQATPFVGREREMEQLVAMMDACIAERTPRAVIVTGPPGIGKSRLRRELVRTFRQRDARLNVLLGRGHPLGARSPFSTLAPALLCVAGIRGDEPVDDRYRKLIAVLSRYFPPAEVTHLAQVLAPTVGLTERELIAIHVADGSDAPLSGVAAPQDGSAAEAGHPPHDATLVVLEDLHWGDVASIQCVDGALRRFTRRPVFVLALAQPEVDEVFPSLWSARPVERMVLGPLSRKATESLARSLLGARLGTHKLARLAERSGGNPFYLEELVRAAAEGEHDDLPESVLAMVEARLVALDDAARLVLRAGSVFGRSFRRGGLLALISAPSSADLAAAGDARERGGPLGLDPATVEAALGWLIRAELIDRRHEAHDTHDVKDPANHEFAFRSAILRDAAYAMLTEADARLGHRLAAAWLIKAGEPDLGVVAHHLDRGGDPESAVAWYLRAAQQAREVGDFAAVLSLGERGAACGAAGEALGMLRKQQAGAHFLRGEAHEGRALGREAMGLLRPGSAPWFEAAALVLLSAGRVGPQTELAPLIAQIWDAPADDPGDVALALADGVYWLHRAMRRDLIEAIHDRIEAFPAAEIEQNPKLAAALYFMRTQCALLAGDSVSCIRAAGAARESFLRAGDPWRAAAPAWCAGAALNELGCYEEASRRLSQATEIAERLGVDLLSATMRAYHGLALAHLGLFDEALETEAESLELFLVQGSRRMVGVSRTFTAFIHTLRGDHALARREVVAAIELTRDIPPGRAGALALLAILELKAGAASSALVAAGEARDILRAAGGLYEHESLVRLVYAESLLAVGDKAGGRAALHDAHARLTARAAMIDDPLWRQSFLGRVLANARTIALANDALAEAPLDVRDVDAR